MVSRVVDDLLPEASDQTVLNMIEYFEKDLRSICSDPFASHVLQQLLHVATYRAYNVIFTYKFNNHLTLNNLFIKYLIFINHRLQLKMYLNPPKKIISGLLINYVNIY